MFEQNSATVGFQKLTGRRSNKAQVRIPAIIYCFDSPWECESSSGNLKNSPVELNF